MTAEPLHYAADQHALKRISSVTWALRMAIICGALPLVTGVAIFAAWLITSWQWLEYAGIITLYAGFGLFVVGAVALGVCIYMARSVSPRLHLGRRVALAAILLLSNFPVAGVIVEAAIALETRYTVVVHHASKQPLADVLVFGGGCSERIESIPPGATVRRSFYIQHDDELRLQCLRGGVQVSETIDGYVTGSMGGHTTVTVGDNGPFSVQQKR